MCSKNKQDDAALLLILNGATEYKNEELILLEEAAFFEVKRLYKDMPRIEELPILTLDEIKAAFPDEDILNKIASIIIKQRDVLQNKEADINQVLSREYPWYLSFYYLRNIPAKINLKIVKKADGVVKDLSQSFQESTASVSPEPFINEMKEIEKEESYFFSLNKQTLKELHETVSSMPNNCKVLSIKELVKKNFDDKEKYIKDSQEKEIIQKATKELGKTIQELGQKNIQDQEKIHYAEERAETAEKRAETAEFLIEEERERRSGSKSRGREGKSRDVSKFVIADKKRRVTDKRIG